MKKMFITDILLFLLYNFKITKAICWSLEKVIKIYQLSLGKMNELNYVFQTAMV